ncbi:MAG: hypothetical protein ACXAB2_15205, partial [Candidatus Hodarchaeales archaeon]
MNRKNEEKHSHRERLFQELIVKGPLNQNAGSPINMDGFEDLLKNTHALVLLCFIGEKLTINGLPSFIDSGKSCDWLAVHGYARERTTKHMHEKPCILSKHGIRLLKRVENRGIVDILNNCRYDSREKFHRDLETQIKMLYETQEIQTHYPQDGIFDHFPAMQKWHQTKIKLQYRIEEWIKLASSHIELQICIICPRCSAETKYIYQVGNDNR